MELFAVGQSVNPPVLPTISFISIIMLKYVIGLILRKRDNCADIRRSGSMYVRIKGNFLEKTKERAKEEAIAEVGKEDAGNDLLYPELKDSIEAFEVTDTGISVSFDTEIGFISVDIPIDADDLIHLIENAVKKFNKIKSVFEGLK